MSGIEKLRDDWLGHLAGVRRLSGATLEAYRRDLDQFLGFLAGQDGVDVTPAGISALKPVDLRAFLSQRRRDGAGNRTLMRQLAALRSFARFGARNTYSFFHCARQRWRPGSGRLCAGFRVLVCHLGGISFHDRRLR